MLNISHLAPRKREEQTVGSGKKKKKQRQPRRDLNPGLPIDLTTEYVSQTLSGYLRSDTCFSSCLSLLLRTLSALSVLPSLVARTCQAYLFSRGYLS